ncbi:MAG: hypothetical protein J6Q27_02825 [Clostridia bacterium]|nr:hypothetical protein [Clostridia bacterium]
MWIEYNPNPKGKHVGDCTVRAISKATEQDWESSYSGIAVQGFLMHDMPSANTVLCAYLKNKGFRRKMLADTCPDCYTVKDFCEDHPKGKYILALHGHVLAVENGDYYDSWDSGNETPIYYFEMEA